MALCWCKIYVQSCELSKEWCTYCYLLWLMFCQWIRPVYWCRFFLIYMKWGTLFMQSICTKECCTYCYLVCTLHCTYTWNHDWLGQCLVVSGTKQWSATDNFLSWMIKAAANVWKIGYELTGGYHLSSSIVVVVMGEWLVRPMVLRWWRLNLKLLCIIAVCL